MAVVMVVMVMIMVMLMLFFMIMMMLMLFLMIVMMLMLLLMIVMMLMLLLMIMMMLMLLLFLFPEHVISKFIDQRAGSFHCFQDLCSCDLIPGRCDHSCLFVFTADHGDRGIQFFRSQLLCPAQDDRPRALDLIIIELAEILHVHPDLLCVSNCCQAVHLHIAVRSNIFNGAAYIRKLSYA